MPMWGITSIRPLTVPALAETATLLEQAKNHFLKGKQLYNNKEYPAALEEFQKSYQLIQVPDTQYNIGLCREKLGEWDKAITAFEIYLQGAPGEAERKETEGRIVRAREQMEKEKPPVPAQDTYVPPPLPPPSKSDLKLAKLHFQNGADYYGQKKYEEALEQFQKSYQLFAVPDTQYNIGLCHEKLGRYEEAIAAFELFVSAKPEGQEREEAKARMDWIKADLLASLAQKTKKKEQTGSVKPPGQPLPAPKRQTLYIPPDKTWQVKDSEDPPRQGNSAANLGLVKNLSRPPSAYRTLMWTSLGLSAAGFAAGLIGHFGAKGKQKEHREEAETADAAQCLDADRNLKPGKCADRFGPKLADLEGEKGTYQIVGLTGLVASGLFLVLGGTFFLADSEERIRLSAAPLSGGGQAGVEWSW